jgi:dTDP-4-dehydrorhamnose reductase
MRVLVIGGTGMVGHAVAKSLAVAGMDVVGFARRETQIVPAIVCDLEDRDATRRVLTDGSFDVVLNFSGILNTTADAHPARTVYLNSYAPHWLAGEVEELGSRFIHLSTDCVFSGKRGGYSESDLPDAADLYGRSKAMGEVVGQGLTLRTSVIGPDPDPQGTGLFNWFMAQQGTVRGYSNVFWSGVTNVQLATAVQEIIESGLRHGLVQLSNGERISKFHLLRVLNEAFPRDGVVIEGVDQPVSDKSLTKSTVVGAPSVPNYQEMVEGMRRWVMEHRALYPHYDFA